MPEPTPITLTQYGMMAEKHWREFLPNMVKELERIVYTHFGPAIPKLFRSNRRVIGPKSWGQFWMARGYEWPLETVIRVPCMKKPHLEKTKCGLHFCKPKLTAT